MIDVAEVMSHLVGQECWYAFTREEHFEVVLALGAKIPRGWLDPLLPPDDPRQFKGECDVWLHCPWRLEYANSVLAVSSDYGDTHAWGVERGLDCLFGQRVTRVLVAPPAWDLTIEFEQGHVLRAFCEPPATEDWAVDSGVWLGGMAWTFRWRGDSGVSVGPRGKAIPICRDRWLPPPAPAAFAAPTDELQGSRHEIQDSPASIAGVQRLLRDLTCTQVETFADSDEIRLTLSGGLSLRIQCSWRLERGDTVLVTNCDFFSDSAAALREVLQVLRGATVSGFRASPPAWDPTIEFGDGHVLKLFSDASLYNGPWVSWSVSGPSGFIIAIGPKGQWTTDESQANSPN